MKIKIDPWDSNEAYWRLQKVLYIDLKLVVLLIFLHLNLFQVLNQQLILKMKIKSVLNIVYFMEGLTK